MFEKLCVIFFIVYVAFAQMDSDNWDLAVVVKDRIELLQSNGTVIGSTIQESSILKALTFDSVRQRFIVSGMEEPLSDETPSESLQNDTIFAVQLTKETDTITPILQDLPDDVQGLSIDPITDTLYWTDSINKTINYISLRKPSYQSIIFKEFANKHPQGVAVDICGRRIFWTNRNVEKPTIESLSLDGRRSKIIVDQNLVAPYGITVDYYSKKIYWVDMWEGIYYQIESVNFDGTDRRSVYKGTHSKPFGVTVDIGYIYWTDVTNDALWRLSKFDTMPELKLVRNFDEKPMDIVANNRISKLEDCKRLTDMENDYLDNLKEHQSTTTATSAYPGNLQNRCLNGGEFSNGECKCSRGFTGKYCDISLCYNYCVHGDCRMSQAGFLMCQCTRGYEGRRCEKNVCDGYCLNEGECIHDPDTPKSPKCSCLNGFAGKRCEINLDAEYICSMFCADKTDDILLSKNNDFICRCDHGSYTVMNANATAEMLSTSEEEHLPFIQHFQDPAFLILSLVVLIMFVILLFLTYLTCKQRRRPRIKKRFIVNKNVTPLTYRPHPNTEQCEITIENCCNMNVCETPCFEPPKLRNFTTIRTDDRKKLLSNMENYEDHY